MTRRGGPSIYTGCSRSDIRCEIVPVFTSSSFLLIDHFDFATAGKNNENFQSDATKEYSRSNFGALRGYSCAAKYLCQTE